jgi:cytochrome c oxidase assembly protein subunit 15
MSNPINSRSSLVYLAAMLVTLLTFPLIWLGGLVTTHDAGMAVPDWPGTFGYNLFLYPISAWLYGPFDLFVEHGHRQLAAVIGLFAIVLCVIAYRNETRHWVVKVCFFFLAAIIAQGVLGGVRVLLDARTIAMIHGCSGPLVFALGSFIAMATSKRWHLASPTVGSNRLGRVAIVLLTLSVSQLFVGAHLRHSLPAWLPAFFMSLVHTHLLMASLILIAVFYIAVLVRNSANSANRELRTPSNALLVIVAMQILLGFATWIANYATPWVELTPWLAKYTVQGKGFWESMIITGHQATGSLLIVCSLWLACRSYRRLPVGQSVASLSTELEPAVRKAFRPESVRVGVE